MNKLMKGLRQIGCLLICLSMFSVFLLNPLRVKAEDNKEKCKNVKVAWYEDSYHISGSHGERSGYAYEYEQAVAAYTGWEYDYVSGDWSELVDKLKNGEVDLMAALSYTDERAKTMLFSDKPMGQEKYFLYADLKNSDISSQDLSTLNDKPVIVMPASVQATQFYEWEEKYNIKTKHIFADSIDQAKEMFRKHEAIGVVSSETSIWVDDGLSAIVTTGGSDIYYGINKNRPELKEELDIAMRSIENDKPFFADSLYEQYLQTQSISTLSIEEQEWLKNHGKIKVGYLNNDPGFSSLDYKSGKIIGVINDYIDYAKTCLGQTLEFELCGFESSKEQLEALNNNQIDMIFHVTQNPYLAEENKVALSNTVLSVPVSVVTTQNAFNESSKNRVGVIKDKEKYKWYISYNYPKWEIIEYDSINDAEKAVQLGKVDCFLTRSADSMEYINSKEFHSVFLTKKANSSFAVKRGNVTLISILNKTLKSMQTSKLTGAVSMYEDSLKKVTIVDFIKDNLLPVMIVFITIVLVVLTVITRLLHKAKKAEEKAKEALKQAENANAAKSNFLFNMSHDIRTPMNALLGYNQLMKNELKDPELLHYQSKMEQAGSLLLSIINNVLEMARIESGKMELDENYAEVGLVCSEIMAVFESEAKKKEIELIYEGKVNQQHIMCDITKVKQIIVNLLSNALKYTPTGGKVILRTTEIPCSQKGFVMIKTEVIDNGIGMSKDFIPKIYDPFSREKNTTFGRVAGTGLGMPIVKELVDMMGGSIDVESEPGEGTQFTVILKHRIANEEYYIKKPNQDGLLKTEVFKGKHILLAEDNELNAEIALTILEGMGFIVDCVKDGIQCVNRIEQRPAHTYDLILMDIQMPNMDGYKATESIRSLPDKEKSIIPIVAMTANAFEEDRKMALSKGMNDHIAKPIDVKKVEEALFSILKNK